MHAGKMTFLSTSKGTGKHLQSSSRRCELGKTKVHLMGVPEQSSELPSLPVPSLDPPVPYDSSSDQEGILAVYIKRPKEKETRVIHKQEIVPDFVLASGKSELSLRSVSEAQRITDLRPVWATQQDCVRK